MAGSRCKDSTALTAVAASPSRPPARVTFASTAYSARVSLLVVREAETRRHHDQQRALVDEAELEQRNVAYFFGFFQST